MHRRSSGILYLVTIALVVAATWSLPGSAAAQGDTIQLTVGGILCQDADCIDHSNLIASFTISALDSASGDVLASCTTDAADPHICTLEIPADADYTLAWDDAQVPEGYEWRGDLYPVADGPFGSATLIPFVPDQATEVPTDVPTEVPTDVPTEAPTVIAEPGHVTIQVALCTDATCGTFAELLDDFTLSAINPDTGEVYSRCTTDNAQQGLDHQCILDVPGEGAWDITWDDSQVPAGYAYFGQPITSGEPSMMTIAFVPTAEPTQTPTIAPTQAASVTPTQAAVTALPSTGAGPHDGATPWTALLVVIAAALLTGALGFTGLHHTAFASFRRHDDR